MARCRRAARDGNPREGAGHPRGGRGQEQERRDDRDGDEGREQQPQQVVPSAGAFPLSRYPSTAESTHGLPA